MSRGSKVMLEQRLRQKILKHTMLNQKALDTVCLSLASCAWEMTRDNLSTEQSIPRDHCHIPGIPNPLREKELSAEFRSYLR